LLAFLLLLLLQILLPSVNVADEFAFVPYNVAYVPVAIVVVFVAADLDVATLWW